MSDTLVIGAGMAGIACAAALHEAGLPVRVMDKGRGIGGRMATRRAATAEGETRFDHGAPYLSARSAEFTALIAGLRDAVAPWEDGSERAHHVGLPGMSGLPRALACGLDVQQGVEATAVEPAGSGWRVLTKAAPVQASRIVLTLPAPQIPGLIGSDHPLAASLGGVEMAPGLTVMAAFAPESPRPFASRRADQGPLAYIAQDSSKPGRRTRPATWVAQASAAWSARHLEVPRTEIAARMLPLLCAAIGADPAQALQVDAHRWRYARTRVPLGRSFLRDAAGGLYLGGDWCLGPRAEDAWQSGRAIAADILESHNAG